MDAGISGRPFDETDHMRVVMPGRHRKVAGPESLTLGQWLWVPGSPLRGATERRRIWRKIQTEGRAHEQGQTAPHASAMGRTARPARRKPVLQHHAGHAILS